MSRALATSLATFGLALCTINVHAQTLLVFGDSLSDNGLAWQHSLTQAGDPVPPSPPYWQGRFSNGPVAVEIMAQTLGYTLDDRAWGGATTDTRNILNGGFGNFDNTGVQSQVSQYLQASPSIATNTQVVLWAGANDLFLSKTPASISQTLANLQGVSQQLIKAGARQILLPLLPDLGVAPFVVEGGATSAQSFHNASESVNAGLLTLAASLSGQNPGITIRTFDTPSFVQNLISGGLDGTTPCVSGGFWGVESVCANPDQHVFWDGTHFSAVVHQQLGVAMAAVVPEPSTYLLWGLGILALGMATRRHRL